MQLQDKLNDILKIQRSMPTHDIETQARDQYVAN